MANEPVANILVVDDDPRSLMAMESLLAGPGRRIIRAQTGNDALRCLLRQEFALILMDVRLPDMDGFETAKLIRGSERLRNIPIIFISAIDTLEEDVFKGSASGAVDYLFKPVVPQVLQGKVAVFINLYHRGPADGFKTRRVLSGAALSGHYREQSWCVRRDGSRFWAEVQYARIGDAAGGLAGFCALVRDLTRATGAQPELERLKAEPEQPTAERLQAIAQRESLNDRVQPSQGAHTPLGVASMDKGDRVPERGGGRTILFADDEENQLQLMRRFLEAEGYKVSAAKDGAEALEVFLKNKDTIDLPILDLRLPKLNGWDAFKQMREARPEIKAIFATGLVSPEIEAEVTGQKLGSVIHKPYRLDSVLKKIAEVLHQRPG